MLSVVARQAEFGLIDIVRPELGTLVGLRADGNLWRVYIRDRGRVAHWRSGDQAGLKRGKGSAKGR